MQRLGELAAFGTSVSWTIGALVMERSVNRVGVMAVNTMKVAFACVYLAVFAYFVNGQFFPLGVSGSAWFFIAASAFFGFVIGDYFLFHAYALIGSRLAMLLMSVSVPLTAIAAYFIFGEAMGTWAMAGMALCVAGIALTVLSGKSGARDAGVKETGGDTQTACAAGNIGRSRSRRYAKGVAFGLLSGVCMAVATLCTKRGAAGIDSVSATQIRILCAFIGFVAFAVLTRKTGEIRAAIVNPRAMVMLAIGGIFGPFIGVGLLLYAIQHADAGVVSTLSSFPPVLIIPPSILLFGKRVRPGEIAGAVVAVAGLALLFA